MINGMNNKKVVILNAPSGVGKDCVAEELSKLYGFHHREFKGALFDVAKAVAQISDDEWDELYKRENKDTRTERLFGRSPREHMIHTSEELIKPIYGKEYFGKALCMSLGEGINIISDGGFHEELNAVKNHVGIENVVVIRIHRIGYSFIDDSRDWLYNTGCKEFDVYNDYTLDELYKNCHKIIRGMYV